MEFVNFLCDHCAAMALFNSKGMLTGGFNPCAESVYFRGFP